MQNVGKVQVALVSYISRNLNEQTKLKFLKGINMGITLQDYVKKMEELITEAFLPWFNWIRRMEESWKDVGMAERSAKYKEM